MLDWGRVFAGWVSEFKWFSLFSMISDISELSLFSILSVLFIFGSCRLAKEADDKIKASLRSKSDVDVRKIAEYFGGGGHTKAAGLAIKYSTLEEARDKILSKIEEEL